MTDFIESENWPPRAAPGTVSEWELAGAPVFMLSPGTLVGRERG